jgi:molybdopterin synthase sulfur carrier subunit
MATLLLFGPARAEAGISKLEITGDSVGAVLEAATVLFGDQFSRVLRGCKVWLNGEVADLNSPLGDSDEVAVLPAVSGG